MAGPAGFLRQALRPAAAGAVAAIIVGGVVVFVSRPSPAQVVDLGTFAPDPDPQPAPVWQPAPPPAAVATPPPAVPSTAIQPQRPVETALQWRTEEPKPEPAAIVRTPPRPPVARTDLAAIRAQVLAERSQQATTAINLGNYDEALQIIKELQRDDPQSPTVGQLLQRAREAIRVSMQEALRLASVAENASDWPEALTHYQRAQQLDPTVAVTEPSIARVRMRMNADAADSFKRARQYDALERTADAIAWYERAVRFMDIDNPLRRTAEDRLNALKATR